MNVLKYDSATIHRIKDDIQAAFGHTVDLGERSTLTTKAAETAARVRVRVF